MVDKNEREQFGKSLLVSTLEAIVTGKRELFKGLAIGQFTL